MADGIKGFTEVTTPNDADAIYLQTSANADGYVTASNFGAYFGSALYTVETATDNKSITSTAVNYMLVFTRQATAKTITLPDAGTTGRTIKIVVTGTGVGNVTLANGDSATVGGFAVGDWEWDGTGNLTLIDDGTNWQVGEAGIWDTYDVTYDSIDYPQDKYTNGNIVRRGYDKTASFTQAIAYALLSDQIPNTGEYLDINALMGAWNGIVYRSDASTLTVQGITMNTGAQISYTFNAAGTGTAGTLSSNGTWETKNTKWSV